MVLEQLHCPAARTPLHCPTHAARRHESAARRHHWFLVGGVAGGVADGLARRDLLPLPSPTAHTGVLPLAQGSPLCRWQLRPRRRVRQRRRELPRSQPPCLCTRDAAEPSWRLRLLCRLPLVDQRAPDTLLRHPLGVRAAVAGGRPDDAELRRRRTPRESSYEKQRQLWRLPALGHSDGHLQPEVGECGGRGHRRVPRGTIRVPRAPPQPLLLGQAALGAGAHDTPQGVQGFGRPLPAVPRDVCRVPLGRSTVRCRPPLAPRPLPASLRGVARLGD
mmetsp:Transcript_2890/g.8236  ORF Transcript_2890/g.8236 Transcript_2890/m.8236 type:complete len:276 (-) Transcript_2890:1789-2616(-)